MSKFQKKTEETVDATSEKQPELNEVAHALIKFKGTSNWAVITVNFNVDTKEATVTQIEPAGDSREEAEYRYKIKVAHRFMSIQ